MENRYKKLCNKKSDINEHLQKLKIFGEDCEHITEFGVRKGISTCAFLMAKPKKFICYDIKLKFPIKKYSKWAKENNVDFKFIKTDVLTTVISKTDLLFIDTYHTYNQLIQELTLHSHKVKKYIILHDVETFGIIGEDNQSDGLLVAADEFLSKTKNWLTYKHYHNNNGLLILKRCG